MLTRVDNVALATLLLAIWGTAVATCYRDRRSLVRWTPLVALAVGVGTLLLGHAETAAIGFGLSAGSLILASGPTSPSLIPLVPILPAVAFAAGAGLNVITPWLGTVLVGAVHAAVLVRGRWGTDRASSRSTSQSPDDQGHRS